MRIPMAMLLAVSLLRAQPADKQGLFQQDPQAIMRICAEQARKLDPKDSRLLAKCGRVCLAGGDRAQAEEAFRLALLDDPKDAETHRLIALAWLKAGFQAEALQSFNAMVKFGSADRKALGKAAVNLMDAGLPVDAERMMIRSILSNKKFERTKSNEELFSLLDQGPSDTQIIKVMPPSPVPNNSGILDPAAAAAHGANPNLFPKPGRLPGPPGVSIGVDISALISLSLDGYDCIAFGRAALRAKLPEMAAKWFDLTVKARPKEEQIWADIAVAYADNGALGE